MEIRNNAEDLRTLLGVPSTSSPQPQQVRSGNAVGQSAFAGDRATLSDAGTEASQSAADAGVRAEKVVEVQAALAAGTYSVPMSAVAGKLVDAMLGNGSEN